MEGCKSHADRLGIPRGVSGETVQGVLIADSHRVSGVVHEDEVSNLKLLLEARHEVYRRNNVKAVVFGLNQADGTALYALYAQPKGNNAKS